MDLFERVLTHEGAIVLHPAWPHIDIGCIDEVNMQPLDAFPPHAFTPPISG
jgi:hypothetical protein